MQAEEDADDSQGNTQTACPVMHDVEELASLVDLRSEPQGMKKLELSRLGTIQPTADPRGLSKEPQTDSMQYAASNCAHSEFVTIDKGRRRRLYKDHMSALTSTYT